VTATSRAAYARLCWAAAELVLSGTASLTLPLMVGELSVVEQRYRTVLAVLAHLGKTCASVREMAALRSVGADVINHNRPKDGPSGRSLPGDGAAGAGG